MSDTPADRPAPPAAPKIPAATIEHVAPAGAPVVEGAVVQDLQKGPGAGQIDPAGMRTVAVVLTQARRVIQGQNTYLVPVGQVIRILRIRTEGTFDAGPDTKLVPAAALKLGDTVSL